MFGLRVLVNLLIAVVVGLRPSVVLAEEHDSPASPVSHTLEVPIDHRDPGLGRGPISYELGAEFDASKPTVLVIADAQQFYVQPGRVAEIQAEYFGPEFNVAGVIGRGQSEEFIRAVLDDAGKPDWKLAWRVFNSEQWIGDIEAVRRDLLGPDGKVLVYGESGGALLVHEYLTRHGEHVARAFTAASINRVLEARLGVNSDRFWHEIAEHDPELQGLLRSALERHAEDRSTVMMTLQRQNFFVPPEELPKERARLIRALAEGDEEHFAALRKQYEVDAVREILASDQAIPIRVRIFEFVQPVVAEGRFDSEVISPDLELQRDVARPLIELHAQGLVPGPVFETQRLHELKTEVFVLAGRWDHTVDYRSSVALAASYPQGHLFLADDDHMFKALKEGGHFYRLLRTFLGSGPTSPAFTAALEAAAEQRWREW